jgi:uncharacterized protein (TIGR04222 family)
MPIWMLHNPVADMPGPRFLAAFWVVTSTLIASVYLTTRRLDPSLGFEPFPLDSPIGPRAIACLRDGARGLLQSTVFDLWSRGFLALDEPGDGPRRFVRSDSGPDSSELDGFERDVLDQFKSPRPLATIGTDAELVGLALEEAVEVESVLEDDLLLMPAGARSTARWLGLLAALMLFLFAAYKVGVALANDHWNILFLILSTALALIGVTVAATVRRTTRRGADYLRRLRQTFAGYSNRLRIAETANEDQVPQAAHAVAVLGCVDLSPPMSATGGSVDMAGGVDAGAGCGGGGGDGGGGGGGCGGGGCGGGGCGGCGS